MAETWYERAGKRWLQSMLRGDFEAAWEESDALREGAAPDPHKVWNGEALAGKRVIMRSLHGFGDAVQMLRYAPRLAEMAASVIYEVPPKFTSLARMFHGVDHVIPWGEDAPSTPPIWDIQIEIMELPYLFRTTIEDLPLATGYLEIPQGTVMQTASAMGKPGTPRVGLVWAAGEWNTERSVPRALLASLLNLAGLNLHGLEFWSLQEGVADENTDCAMSDAAAICGDGLVALAATIANLDLVITVDTLAAHLAGALGIPAWVMLQHGADWRWMRDRQDSPWYPKTRLFRQTHAGDWKQVVQEISEALEAQYAKS